MTCELNIIIAVPCKLANAIASQVVFCGFLKHSALKPTCTFWQHDLMTTFTAVYFFYLRHLFLSCQSIQALIAIVIQANPHNSEPHNSEPLVIRSSNKEIVFSVAPFWLIIVLIVDVPPSFLVSLPNCTYNWRRCVGVSISSSHRGQRPLIVIP